MRQTEMVVTAVMDRKVLALPFAIVLSLGNDFSFRTDDHSPRLTLNVGGTRFEITSTSLDNVPDGAGKLANLKRLFQTEAPHSDEYYFDRDPEAFESIINYCRCGFLHVPLVRIAPLLSTCRILVLAINMFSQLQIKICKLCQPLRNNT